MIKNVYILKLFNIYIIKKLSEISFEEIYKNNLLVLNLIFIIFFYYIFFISHVLSVFLGTTHSLNFFYIYFFHISLLIFWNLHQHKHYYLKFKRLINFMPCLVTLFKISFQKWFWRTIFENCSLSTILYKKNIFENLKCF